jgi:cytoskeletal protein CcmA (bactofilin family)
MANQPGGPHGPAPSLPVPSAHDPRSQSGSRRPTIGAATALRGQLSAREDLWIEGQFEGEVQAPSHQVTVSTGGRVRADVRARAVVVEGELVGNVHAEQMVLLRAGSVVHGDIRAPRVGLEEGCQFQGNVDMDGTLAVAKEPAPSTGVAVSEPKPEGAAPPTPQPERVAAPQLAGQGAP